MKSSPAKLKSFQGKIVQMGPLQKLQNSTQTLLYNNQINACTLIGQSAVGYCASKPREKSCIF